MGGALTLPSSSLQELGAMRRRGQEQAQAGARLEEQLAQVEEEARSLRDQLGARQRWGRECWGAEVRGAVWGTGFRCLLSSPSPPGNARSWSSAWRGFRPSHPLAWM